MHGLLLEKRDVWVITRERDIWVITYSGVFSILYSVTDQNLPKLKSSIYHYIM